MFAHFKILGQFNAGNKVADAGNSQQIQPADQCRRYPEGREISLAGRFVKQTHQADRRFIINGHHQVKVFDVVNPRYVLITDALDTVFPKSVLQQRRALQRFAGGNFTHGELSLEKIATSDGPGRTGSRYKHPEMISGFHDKLKDFQHSGSGDLIMPEVVAEFIELVENYQILSGFP